MLCSPLIALLLAAVTAVAVYIWLIWNFAHWRQRGVRARTPRPLVGSFSSLLTQKRHFVDELNDLYNEYRDTEHYIGVYLMRVPQLLLLEPSLVRQVFVTEFSHFQDNDICLLVDHRKDPLIACNPFILEGQRWREQRALITPGLASARIKVSYDIMRGVCATMCDYVRQQMQLAAAAPSATPPAIDAMDLAARFTAENVSASVLGIEALSFTTHPLPIAQHMCDFAQNNTLFIVYNVMMGLLPSIHRWYKPKFVPPACEHFFIELLRRAFALRRAAQGDAAQRPDFLNHLLALQRRRGLTDIELASHAWTFLIDGLDTTASAIAHCLFLLARNGDVQAKLRTELQGVAGDDGQLSFEQLSELPYLDACVHESLRLFSPGLWATKRCTAAHEFSNKDGRWLRIAPGETVIVPVHSLHMDAAYYAEPTRYAPERFLDAGGDGVKRYREQGVYLAFGAGPRQCLGMRFALTQVKSAVVALVRGFGIAVHARTERHIQLDPKSFVAKQRGGIYLDFKWRN